MSAGAFWSARMASMFTQQETAQRLGKTEAAVRQNLHAARKRLTKYLAQIDDEGNRRHDTGEEDR
jgi:DNA-directed RNA polymerase specialized sigma24 family protein